MKGRNWLFYIQDMIDFSEKVLAYTEGMDQEAFLADDADLRRHLAQLGTDRRGGHPHSGISA